MNNKNFVRIVALVLAVLMLLGVLTGAILTTFAASDEAIYTVASMGEASKALPIAVCCIGAVAVILCIAVPKIKNKNNNDKD